MAGLYADTCALGRVILDEPDGSAILTTIASYDALWSSELLLVELRRLGLREQAEARAETLVAGVSLEAVDRESLERASRLEPLSVRSLDSIHLEAAVGLARDGLIDAVLTYDHQLQAGCAHHQLRVEAPEPLQSDAG